MTFTLTSLRSIQLNVDLFPSACYELTATTEACNSGNVRRNPLQNVDLRSYFGEAGVHTGALSKEFLTGHFLKVLLNHTFHYKDFHLCTFSCGSAGSNAFE